MLEVWCLLTISLSQVHGETEPVETAVKGQIVAEDENAYSVDFADYASAKAYYGDWSKPRIVARELCTHGSLK